MQLLTDPSIDAVSVKSVSGDVYTASIGTGYRPSLEEFSEALDEISVMADQFVMDYPDFYDWTPEQRTMMATREQAILIARRFYWTLEGGRP